LLLWWAPPWQTPLALTAHVTLAYMVADTLQTLISIPFYSLTPEMTEDYDERTSLSTYRMLFNLAASLVAAAGAPEIVRLAPSPQQGYLLMAGLFGLMGALPFIGIFFAARERKEHSEQRAPLVTESLQAAWNNVPFRIATTINLLNWVALDLVQLMLPYFIFVWVEQGNMNATVQLPIGNVGIASVTLFILIATAIVTLPLWAYLAGAWNKRSAYIAGMLFWAVVQTLLITIQPGQHTYIYVLSFLGGIGVSTAHVLPDALFPDVLEWDELRTGTRREGTYYGIRTLIRKVTGAVAIFLAGQTLGLFHYQTPPEGATFFQQAPEAQLAIRILTGPAAAVLLAGAIIAAFFYPLSREHHNRIRNLLVKRRQMRRLRAATSQSRNAP
jgi:GPH family glycoside/pentoside/hexuronide:cation symporter